MIRSESTPWAPGVAARPRKARLTVRVRRIEYEALKRLCLQLGLSQGQTVGRAILLLEDETKRVGMGLLMRRSA